MKSCNWLSSRRRKRRDREPESQLLSSRLKTKPSRLRRSRSSKTNNKTQSKLRLSSTNKRRTSIPMLRRPSQSGRAKARTLSPSSWSLRITKSALSEDRFDIDLSLRDRNGNVTLKSDPVLRHYTMYLRKKSDRLGGCTLPSLSDSRQQQTRCLTIEICFTLKVA